MPVRRESQSISVIVPAFNEAPRIERTVVEIQRWFGASGLEWELRVVDDGSTDGTAAIVDRLTREDARIVVQREPHRGKGGAVRAGMLAAGGGLRFMCDADLSMPLDELPRLLAMVPDRCDIALGSREGRQAVRVDEPAHRHWMGRVFNTLIQRLVLPGISDSQCGFKVFTAAAARAIFPHTTIEGWAFDVETLFIARLQGWRVQEVPIEWHYQPASKVSVFRDPLMMARDVWRIRANGRRGLYGARQ